LIWLPPNRMERGSSGWSASIDTRRPPSCSSRLNLKNTFFCVIFCTIC
jgi:hypothetical protein